MVHERFDLERWIAEFPLERLRREARDFIVRRRQELPDEYPNEAAFERHVELMMPKADIITSPVTAAVIEQLRREVWGNNTSADAVATDIFVMARGEPPRRDLTKVGGLPYWPAARPWPMGRDGEPMVYLAQFCFTDSRDLVGDIPGDVLVVFDKGRAYGELNADDLHCEWVRQTGDALVNTAPRSAESPWACYGVIHRTFDVPVPEDFWRKRSMTLLKALQATKIGGLPPWVQPPDEVPGRYLATLGSVNPAPGKFPFINVPEPEGHSYFERRDLMWGDVGNAYLFLQSDGAVIGTIDCY